MEQQVHTSEVCDYRQYDRIWQRVAPALEPYPGMRTAAEAPLPANAAAGPEQPRQEALLPGAIPDPCCMGSAAAEMMRVLTGFAEEELEARRHYLALSRYAPVWARQQLRELAEEEGAHARRLLAVCYLITGECVQLQREVHRPAPLRWCPALRERYHAEACSGLNYARAAEGTADPCLRTLLDRLSTDAYRHADRILILLERALRGA